MELLDQLDAFSSFSTQMRREMETALKSERTRAESLQKQMMQTAMRAEEEVKTATTHVQSKDKEIQTMRAQINQMQAHVKTKNAEVEHYKKIIVQLQVAVKNATQLQARSTQLESRIRELEGQLQAATKNQSRIERIEAKLDHVVKAEHLAKLEQSIVDTARTLNQLENLSRSVAGQHGEMLQQSVNEIKKIYTESVQSRNKGEMATAQAMLHMNSGFKMIEKQVQNLQTAIAQNAPNPNESMLQAQMQTIQAQLQATAIATAAAVNRNAAPAVSNVPANTQSLRAVPAEEGSIDAEREAARLKRENQALRASYQKSIEEVQNLKKDFASLQESSLIEIDRLREREQTLREHVSELFGEPEAGTGTA